MGRNHKANHKSRQVGVKKEKKPRYWIDFPDDVPANSAIDLNDKVTLNGKSITFDPPNTKTYFIENKKGKKIKVKIRVATNEDIQSVVNEVFGSQAFFMRDQS